MRQRICDGLGHQQITFRDEFRPNMYFIMNLKAFWIKLVNKCKTRGQKKVLFAVSSFY